MMFELSVAACEDRSCGVIVIDRERSSQIFHHLHTCASDKTGAPCGGFSKSRSMKSAKIEGLGLWSLRHSVKYSTGGIHWVQDFVGGQHLEFHTYNSHGNCFYVYLMSISTLLYVEGLF
jgi:hypothetical protein